MNGVIMRKIVYSRILSQIWVNFLRSPYNGRIKFFNRFISFRKIGSIRSIYNPKALPPLIAFTLTISAKIDPKEQQKKLFEQADELFNANKFDQMIDLLKSIEDWEMNNEVLWRVARCKYHQLKYRTDKGSAEYLSILEYSFSLIEKALKINDKCGPAYKWAAIILEEYSTAQGMKVRIANLLRLKEFMEKAIEYSPEDPTTYYLLGEWHYGCASVTWVERNIASLIFGTLPEASYESALLMFEKAENIEPGFYSKNQIMLAKTLLTLNRDKDKATNHLKSIVSKYKNSQKWADVEACKEAVSLLKKIGEKVPY